MHGRLRMDVLNRHHLLVFVDDLGGRLALDDSAEKASLH